jgi:RNA polymerase sigma factor (sigma-70 family)
MVLGVCRRVLVNEADAEDAFQATFLAFARTAGSIRVGESVGGWLYRVAGRVARKARGRRSRFVATELTDLPAPSLDPAHIATQRNLHAVLDEEITRLPSKFRAPMVLCYLEGRTNAEAGLELGWPEGTVATRLAAARQRLRLRLTRRGLGISGAVLTALLAQPASAPAGTPLVLATVRAALKFGASRVPAESCVSGPVAALTKGALQAMFLARFWAGAAMTAAVGVAFLLVVFAAHQLQAGRPDADAKSRRRGGPDSRQPAATKQERRAQGRLLFYRAGHLTLINPDGKEEKKVSKDRGKFHPGDSWLSPDGKRIAYLVQVEVGPLGKGDPRRKVYVRGLNEAEPGTDLEVEAQRITWSPDGKHVVATEAVQGEEPKSVKFINWLVDVKTKEKTALKIADSQMVTDWSRDGKHFLTVSVELGKEGPAAQLHLVSRDGKEEKVLTPGKGPAFFGRLSPDGRKVLYLARDPQRKGKDFEGSVGLFALDIRQGKVRRVEGQPLNGTIMGFCWSPDGRRIAYTWRQDQGPIAPGQKVESHLVVSDPDGANPLTIATERGDFAGLITIGNVDWR